MGTNLMKNFLHMNGNTFKPFLVLFKYLFLLLIFSLLTTSALALEPEEVVVIVNSYVTESVSLAKDYMQLRGIPKENLIKVNLKPREVISREDYFEDIAEPIRKALARHPSGSLIRCLVTMTGMPLIVMQPELTRDEENHLNTLKDAQKAARERLAKLAATEVEQAKALKYEIDDRGKEITKVQRADERAALDSELALVNLENFDLAGWLPNPFFAPLQQQPHKIRKEQTLMVSRLDAPSIEIVRRMIQDSLNAEKTGLHGKGYFDARYPRTAAKGLKSYALYDQSIYRAAEDVEASGRMPVVVNEEARLFVEGEAPDAALYCGWYSLANYVDAFDWVPGAVGYHIASQECQTLKGNGKYWCKSMLADGAAATIGPVAEPYLTAFPVPEIFFKALTDGDYTLVEAYILSLPYLSWQMILIGDPLYRPFKN